MKKIISMLIVVAILLTLCGCNKNKKAFELSNLAYENISNAYEIIDEISSDIYEAWRLGIYEDEAVRDDAIDCFADELNLSRREVIDGIAYTIAQAYDEEWDTLSESRKDEHREIAPYVFSLYDEDESIFSMCVIFVKNMYVVRGDIAEARAALDNAKVQMKELSEKYSDYEHYPTLKDFFTKTSAFFDFCLDPEGSFTQAKETINGYRNDIRTCISNLDYIFED